MARRSLTTVVYLGFAAALAALAAVPGGAVWQQPARPPAALVLLNGKVVTADDARPEAQAVAIVGDRIADLGTTEDMKRHVGPNTQVIDLAGRLVIPGFVEGHGHFTGVGLAQLNLNLMKAQTWDEIVAMVARVEHPRRGRQARLLERRQDQADLLVEMGD